VLTFGPNKAAAQLEGSKGFTKDLCARANIPTAAYGRFDNAGRRKAALDRFGLPVVIKADGLAAGKGVVIAETPRRGGGRDRRHVRRRLRRRPAPRS
jgi:phosphoribosylamine--glycine ligase